jgi:hypothetical protein
MAGLAVADARRRFWGVLWAPRNYGAGDYFLIQTDDAYVCTSVYVCDLYLGLFGRVLAFGALRRVRV